MTDKEDIYKNGICACMAAGRFRWVNVGGGKVYMCIKCNKPKYWNTAPPAKPTKQMWEY
jgi:hypothetical protein